MALIRPKSLKELALEHLRSQIIDGTLAMGQVVSERSISEQLGVSKSPVREAFAQLRDEGLMIIEPQKGARVFTLTNDEVAQICDFRIAIETSTFELAFSRNRQQLTQDIFANVERMKKANNAGHSKRYLELDTEFHQLIFKHSDNQYLSASYDRYVGKIAALRTYLAQFPKHTDLSFEEHLLMADAIDQGRIKDIAEIVQTHINRSKETYQEAFPEM